MVAFDPISEPESAYPPASPPLELLSLLRDRRLWKGPALWVLLILVVLSPVVAAWDAYVEKRSRSGSDGAYGQPVGTLAEDPARAHRPVRFDWTCGGEYEKFLGWVPDARKNRLVILSGMSQMYTVNDYRPGDQITCELMDEALAPRGTRVFGLASPNLSQEEALFLLMSTAARPQTKPAVFMFAVSFDKLRNADIRPGYLVYLRQHPGLMAQWRDAAEHYRAKYPLATAKMLETLHNLQQNPGIANKTSFEARLRERVADYVPFVRARRSINGQLQMGLFTLRNWIFHINPTSKRPLIPGLYNTNREFLGLLADIGRDRGVTVALYIVPFNPNADSPYIPEEYAAFKTWLQGFAAEHGTPLANLENAVPSSDWGLFMGGSDFKHFKETGHHRTAAALMAAFPRVLVPETGR